MTAAAKPPASLPEALAALQGQLPAVGKHAIADVKKDGRKLYDYAYAPGESITPVVYPLMSALGLSFIASPTMLGDSFLLRYSLMHSSGEAHEGFYPLPDPAKYGPQDLGKAITYARRYALCALIGLFPGGDDTDALGIAETPRQPRTAAAKTAEKPPAHKRAGAAHERLVHDDAGHDPAKVTRTRPAGPDPDDPWTTDAPVDHQRAAALRESVPTSDPEDKPGSILPSQVRGIGIMLSKLGFGTDDQASRHDQIVKLLDLEGMPPHPATGVPSTHGLSYTQAADLLKMLQEGS